jgi:anti-anti-sigma factor
MAAAQGVVRVHRAEGMVTFRVEDRATMTQAHPFRRCAEQSLAGGAKVLRVDLRRCTYLDSTFLGTLLCLKRDIDRRGQAEFALVSPSPQCSRLFKQMGVDEIFPVVNADEPPASACTDLQSGSEDLHTVKGNVIQAHQELADLPGAAGAAFQGVLRCMNQAQEQEKGK